MKNVLTQCWNKNQQQFYRIKLMIIIVVIVNNILAKKFGIKSNIPKME